MATTLIMLLLAAQAAAYLLPTPVRTAFAPRSSVEPITSPFSETGPEKASDGASDGGNDGPLDLTEENVETVLDTMRPYLLQDGGNVKVVSIDGPVVSLELVGECGSCPSSTQTMKMGLERGLKERIPEIQEVIQAIPEGPPLEVAQVEIVLDSVRPFLSVAGGTIDVKSITGEDSVQPVVLLDMQGASASLASVKLEIQQRIQRHFMMSGLKVDWVARDNK